MFEFIMLAASHAPAQSELNPTDIEQWKELNLTIRHWETLLFDNSKTFFTAVTFALGAAGAVVAWATVGIETRRVVVKLLLWAAIAIASGAIAVIISMQGYLKRFYDRRRTLEERLRFVSKEEEPWRSKPWILRKAFSFVVWYFRKRVFTRSGWTMRALISCFVLTIILCAWFLIINRSYQPERSLLQGARLQGADLRMVSGLTKDDLTNACGDSNTKLPAYLTFTLPPCQP